MSDWPKHMVDAYHYFKEENTVIASASIANVRSWGDRWMDCLECFVEFQQRAGFLDVGASFPLLLEYTLPRLEYG
jgi:hypothetical protein